MTRVPRMTSTTLPFQALAAALTVLALSAGPAHAAADVSAYECVQGGGVIVISAVEGSTDTFTKRCVGGLHDGETIT
ncbi:hypothetical protein [Streptomyces flavalbus]|uniref:Secreted protein n=1 Tax=Streptomyces flavalbus TaxID=2665155 RepID=A0ABW2WKQ8_9ACTN